SGFTWVLLLKFSVLPLLPDFFVGVPASFFHVRLFQGLFFKLHCLVGGILGGRLVLQENGVELLIGAIRPAAQGGPRWAGVWLGNHRVDVLLACLAIFAHLAKRVPPVAVGCLFFWVELDRLIEPFASAIEGTFGEVDVSDINRCVV